MENKRFIKALKKASKGLWAMIPIFFGIILLVNLINTFIPSSFYAKVFSGNMFIDPFIGGFLGSIFTSNPITSYILGGELVMSGVSLVAVTALIVAWVTVGLVSLPAESMTLGKRFAITRNLISFVLSIIVAVITVLAVGLI